MYANPSGSSHLATLSSHGMPSPVKSGILASGISRIELRHAAKTVSGWSGSILRGTDHVAIASFNGKFNRANLPCINIAARSFPVQILCGIIYVSYRACFYTLK
jgi:hypothetical protein